MTDETSESPLKYTHIVAVTNNKGGCGKTTTTLNLGAAAAAAGLDVVIVDVDPQCNTTCGLGVDRDQLKLDGVHTILDIYMKKRMASEVAIPLLCRNGDGEPVKDQYRAEGRLRLVPGHRGLSAVEKRLDADLAELLADDDTSSLDADDVRAEHRGRLKKSIASLRGKCDLVLIDTPPDLKFITVTSLIAADWYIIPVFPSGYDMSGLETLVATAKKVKDRHNKRLQMLGVLLGNRDTRTKLDSEISNLLQTTFKAKNFQTKILRSVRFQEASMKGQTILEHPLGNDQARQFIDLKDELMERLVNYESRLEKALAEKQANAVPSPHIATEDGAAQVADMEEIANG